MRVGIFETTHFEGAYPVIRLFDNGSNEITIFTYEDSYKQFQFLFAGEMQKFNWIVKSNDESKRAFIQTMYKQVKELQIELLYLNTIVDNYIFYARFIRKLKRVRIVTTLHSINNYFQHKPIWSLRRIVRILGKKRLVHVANEFNVVSLTMVDYLKKQLQSSKKVHCVPGAVYEPEKHVTDSRVENRISIVVPGAVDGRRRNYRLVTDLVDQLSERGLQVAITLLGGVDPDHGYAILQSLKSREWNGRLKYYDREVIDQPEFDKVMDESDLVLLPSMIYTNIVDDITEEYGLSMSSGNLFDIIKHAKPFIAPFGLRVDPFLESSCLRYQESPEIVDILVALIESPEVFRSLKEKAKLASMNYTIEAVRSRNADLFH